MISWREISNQSGNHYIYFNVNWAINYSKENNRKQIEYNSTVLQVYKLHGVILHLLDISAVLQAWKLYGIYLRWTRIYMELLQVDKLKKFRIYLDK